MLLAQAAPESLSLDLAQAFAIMAAGFLISILGWRAYRGRARKPLVEEQWVGPPYLGFAAAWLGGGMLLVGIGGLIGTLLPWTPTEVVAGLITLAGFALFVLGGVFVIYLPRRLRPAWFLQWQQRHEHAERRVREMQERVERGEFRQREVLETPVVTEPGVIPPSLPFWVAFGAPVPSRRLVSQVTKVGRPAFRVGGRLSGAIPHVEQEVAPRSGTLWVASDKLIFVQSDEDDLRFDESYVLEIPAPTLVDVAATRTSDNRPAVALVGVPDTLTFQPDDDAEAVVERIREVLAR